MAYNFIDCDQDQLFLLPPSMRDWLPEGHLVWFILDAVDQLDLSSFLRRYRSDGWGRAAYPPKTMVALLFYAYCTGVRSSRKIEQACQENVAFKVITGGRVPDHTTISRFRRTREPKQSRRKFSPSRRPSRNGSAGTRERGVLPAPCTLGSLGIESPGPCRRWPRSPLPPRGARKQPSGWIELSRSPTRPVGKHGPVGPPHDTIQFVTNLPHPYITLVRG